MASFGDDLGAAFLKFSMKFDDKASKGIKSVGRGYDYLISQGGKALASIKNLTAAQLKFGLVTSFVLTGIKALGASIASEVPILGKFVASWMMLPKIFRSIITGAPFSKILRHGITGLATAAISKPAGLITTMLALLIGEEGVRHGLEYQKQFMRGLAVTPAATGRPGSLNTYGAALSLAAQQTGKSQIDLISSAQSAALMHMNKNSIESMIEWESKFSQVMDIAQEDANGFASVMNLKLGLSQKQLESLGDQAVLLAQSFSMTSSDIVSAMMEIARPGGPLDRLEATFHGLGRTDMPAVRKNILTELTAIGAAFTTVGGSVSDASDILTKFADRATPQFGALMSIIGARGSAALGRFDKGLGGMADITALLSSRAEDLLKTYKYYPDILERIYGLNVGQVETLQRLYEAHGKNVDAVRKFIQAGQDQQRAVGRFKEAWNNLVSPMLEQFRIWHAWWVTMFADAGLFVLNILKVPFNWLTRGLMAMNKLTGGWSSKIIFATMALVPFILKLLVLKKIISVVGFGNIILGARWLLTGLFNLRVMFITVSMAIRGYLASIGLVTAANTTATTEAGFLATALAFLSDAFWSVWAAITGPVGLVVIGIVAVSAVVYELAKHWDQVVPAVNRAKDAMGRVGERWGYSLGYMLGEFARWSVGVWEGFMNLVHRITNYDWSGTFHRWIKQADDWVKAFKHRIATAFSSSPEEVFRWLSSIPRRLYAWFSSISWVSIGHKIASKIREGLEVLTDPKFWLRIAKAMAKIVARAFLHAIFPLIPDFVWNKFIHGAKEGAEAGFEGKPPAVKAEPLRPTSGAKMPEKDTGETTPTVGPGGVDTTGMSDEAVKKLINALHSEGTKDRAHRERVAFRTEGRTDPRASSYGLTPAPVW